jgi:hypothetical protein
MLHEIAITPSVFYKSSYSSADVCDAHMQGIWEALLEWLLTRNLRAGDWYRELGANRLEMPHQAQKLLKQLVLNHRFTLAPPESEKAPTDSQEWCQEALASHRSNALAGILACPSVKQAFRKEQLVASIANRSSSKWWQNHVGRADPQGPRIKRTIESYLTQLDKVLRFASHIMFLDPHLDPTRPGYKDFLRILQAASRTNGPKPKLEIHRVCYEGSGHQRNVIANAEWERRFRSEFDAPLRSMRLSVEVFIWSDEHERHLISNLIGLHLGNGFDVSRDPNARTTWTRLSSADRDSIQRDFDPAVRGSKLIHRFSIGV